MKFSYNWLSTYFDEPLPPPEALAEKITFHSSEIEELLTVGSDTVFDVKVLPDKSAWLMSHRGLAKEISVILNLPMKSDIFRDGKSLSPQGDNIKIKLESTTCDFYGAALVCGITVGPSPLWLRERLEAVGQRSINNIVDATNYVMFETGQPLHAFDADKFEGGLSITVRNAHDGEKFTTLSKEELTLDTNDAVITNGETGKILALAGVKGGLDAGVAPETKNILFEAAHFDRVAVRKTARKYKLTTDAAKRYENGLSPLVSPLALSRVVELTLQIAQGELTEAASLGAITSLIQPVSVTLLKVNSVLGLGLSEGEVLDIFKRFAYDCKIENGVIAVTPSFERDDIKIAEDLIEEIGRIYGLDKVVSVPPQKQALTEFNVRHYYAEKIRTSLISLGFSEVFTSSFRNKDLVKLENSLATDKGFLRSSLADSQKEVVNQNIAHKDLLGLSAIKVFEIGTVFLSESEEFRVALAVQTGTTYKAKSDEPLLLAGVKAIEEACGGVVNNISEIDGVVEFLLQELTAQAPSVAQYDEAASLNFAQYKAFSIYPSISRDVAMWVGVDESVDVLTKMLKDTAGPLCVRLTHVDSFTKEGQTSMAFRLVFQALDRTLTVEEVEVRMSLVYQAITEAGYQSR
jgi:phenylalanyl-tRNA synthetase beta chain